jgi:hypothetical protein
MLGCQEFLQAANNRFFMGKLDHILYLLLTDHLVHLSFKLTDRFDRQHTYSAGSDPESCTNLS